MAIEKENLKTKIGEMRKRREPMADGRRYIIYYTFGDNQQAEAELNSGQTANPQSQTPNHKSEVADV